MPTRPRPARRDSVAAEGILTQASFDAEPGLTPPKPPRVTHNRSGTSITHFGSTATTGATDTPRHEMESASSLKAGVLIKGVTSQGRNLNVSISHKTNRNHGS